MRHKQDSLPTLLYGPSRQIHIESDNRTADTAILCRVGCGVNWYSALRSALNVAWRTYNVIWHSTNPAKMSRPPNRWPSRGQGWSSRTTWGTLWPSTLSFTATGHRTRKHPSDNRVPSFCRPYVLKRAGRRHTPRSELCDSPPKFLQNCDGGEVNLRGRVASNASGSRFFCRLAV